MDPYIDQIGARLAEPEKWPDDVRRVHNLCRHHYKGVGIDLGCSDGAVIRAVMDANPLATFCYAYDERDLTGTLGWHHPRIEFQWGVPWGLPPLSGHDGTTRIRQVDWITATEVLEHHPPLDAQRILERLLAFLVPGGLLIITVPNRAFHDEQRERWSWGSHKSFYTWSSLDSLLRLSCRHVYTALIVDGIWIESVCYK